MEDSPRMDGNAGDWSESPLEYGLEKENISLGVRNDSSNLYLLLRFSDEEWARRISTFGLTLWMDREEKKGKTFGIRYGGGAAVRESLGTGDRVMGGMHTTRGNKPPPIGGIEPGMITVVDEDLEVSLPEDNEFGPKAGSTYQNGFFSYEFEIPLLETDSISHAIGIDVNATIDLGVEIGGMDSETMKRMREDMGDMEPPGGMGGPRGGGQRGMGGMGGPPEGHEDRLDLGPKEFWFKVTLAEGFVDL
jgi:hypothetical protein